MELNYAFLALFTLKVLDLFFLVNIS
jgi:hypothetical protein